MYKETKNIHAFTYFKGKVNVDQIKESLCVYFVPIGNPMWQPPHSIGSICKTKSKMEA